MTIYDDICGERRIQQGKFETGELRWIASEPDCPNELRLAALMEEVGEVARALHDGEPLEAELVQVAAVAVAWLEGIA